MAARRIEALHLTPTRGMSLPHLEAPYVPLFITFRLADSLPGEAVARLRPAGEDAGPEELRRYRKRLEDALDAGHGACPLKDPAVGAIVERLLLEGDGRRYRLYAWCVMPNHVHVIVALLSGVLLRDVVQKWKGASSRYINQHLGRQGPLWQPDYFDRVLSSDRALERTVAYVERNPVEAGLVAESEDWVLSSAAGWRRRSGEA